MLLGCDGREGETVSINILLSRGAGPSGNQSHRGTTPSGYHRDDWGKMKEFCIQSEHVRGEPRVYIVWERVDGNLKTKWKEVDDPRNDWTPSKKKAERL